ncbi:hypothetical protein MRX96_037950 [Rhipicephalus microplus]
MQPQSYQPLPPSSCPNCGEGGHPTTSCPARAAKCNYCGCYEHFAVFSRKKAAEKCAIALTGSANEPVHVLEKVFAAIQWKQRIVRQTVYVVSLLRSILLGIQLSESVQLIKFTDSVSGATRIKASDPQLFGSLGVLKGEYHIRVKPNSMPFALQVARRIALPLRYRVKKELERME